jgi:hypothetical protein
MPRLASHRALLTLLVLSTAACQDDATPDAAFAADSGRDADAGLEPPEPEYECEANLPSLESGIFERGCAFINCHTSAGYAGSLELVEADLQKELVGADSIVCAGWKRVDPGSPETSFLWDKLTREKPACGDRMPLGLTPLPPHALDCVRNWILELPSSRDAGEP